jgi:hypothetical protein
VSRREAGYCRAGGSGSESVSEVRAPPRTSPQLTADSPCSSQREGQDWPGLCNNMNSTTRTAAHTANYYATLPLSYLPTCRPTLLACEPTDSPQTLDLLISARYSLKPARYIVGNPIMSSLHRPFATASRCSPPSPEQSQQHLHYKRDHFSASLKAQEQAVRRRPRASPAPPRVRRILHPACAQLDG